MSGRFIIRIKFPLGQVVATPNALGRISEVEIQTAITRHLSGDWGDVGDEDRQANDEALKKGFRLLSVYHSADDIPFWIITESNRATTTILLPEDY